MTSPAPSRRALSYTQRAMMQRYFAEPESYCNFEFLHLYFHGAIDPERLADAWRAVFRRFPILNSVIRWGEGTDDLCQIYRKAPPPIRILYHLDSDAREVLLAQRRQYRINLRRNLFELILIPGQHGTDMLVNTHHIVYDGWSTSLILDRLLREYQSSDKDGACPLVSSPDAAWEAYKASQSCVDPAPMRAFYQQMLRGYHQPPIRRSQGSSIFSSKSSLILALPIPSDAVGQISRRLQAATGAILTALAARETLRLSHAEDLVVGAVFSCRVLPISGLESCVGPISSVLPLRVRANALPEMVSAVHADMAAMQEMQHIPFDYTAMGDCLPFFSIDSVVLVQNYPMLQQKNQTGSLWVEHREAVYFPDNQITVELQSRAGRWILLYRYDNHIFSRREIEASAGRICRDLLELAE